MLRHSLLLIFLLIFTNTLFAGVGGKLVGKVQSAQGEPLPGVNIIIEGTSDGSASDVSGDYFILNIPPGNYTVKFMMIGYKTAVHQQVQIVSDFTTNLDAVMESQTLDAAEEVVVVSSRPLIKRDATATIRVVGAEDIQAMPVDNFKDILVTQAGFTRDENGGIHVRGGRTKEILYMVDGVVVKDVLEGDFNGSMNQNAIQEMSVISGTFNAEYGQAMSSVVNIVTKDGAYDFAGHLEYTTDQLNSSPYHKPGAFEYLDDAYADEDTGYVYVDLRDSLFSYFENAPAGFYPKMLIPLLNIPVSGKVSLTLGGPITPRSSYYISVLSSGNDSPLPHGVDVAQDIGLKLTTRISKNMKLVGMAYSASRLYQNYSHSWKYVPQNHTHTFKGNDRLSATIYHTLSASSYYRATLSNQRVATKTGVQELTPLEYERPLTDASVYFYASGHQGSYKDNQSTTNTLDLDVVKRINKFHHIKTGINYSAHSLDIYTEEDPWLGGTNFKDDTTYTPNELSFFIQDKIELDYLILNLGVRYDKVDPRIGMWENVANFAVWDSVQQNFVAAPVIDAPAQSKWSPRIGLAYPVTENTVFHFSYGHFFQTPDFIAMTYNSVKDISTSLPLVGNAGVKPQKTVAFEVGVKQALSPNSKITATIWSKDIRDLLSTQSYQIISIPVVVYTNSDYASVKGVDITLDRQVSKGLNFNVSYTLSSARGNNSTPISGYFSAYEDEEVPHKEYYLDFDQRHDLAINMSISTGRRDGPKLLAKYPLSRMNASLLLNVASGLPYTPYVDPTIQVELNSARKPWTYSLDLRVRKELKMGLLKPSIFIEAMNITNHENILVVNSRTGKPFDLGATGLVGSTNDGNLNPAKLGPGRSIKLGMSLGW